MVVVGLVWCLVWCIAMCSIMVNDEWNKTRNERKVQKCGLFNVIPSYDCKIIFNSVS